MLLNHIKSRDLFSSFSDEKVDSGSQNSTQDSQDFLSDLYPSQSTRMYRKYVNEPPLFKSTSKTELHNNLSLSSYQNVDYRKMKEKDDRSLITAIVTTIKDTSNEIKDNLRHAFQNISDLVSKNDGSMEQISDKFGCEFEKQCKKLLVDIKVNTEHEKEIAEKESQLKVLNKQVKTLEKQNSLESKISDMITEKFANHESQIDESLNKFSSSFNKQRSTRSFDSDLKIIESHKKEFSSLKSTVQKSFKDLEKRISSSSQEIILETKDLNTQTNMDFLDKIHDILKNCSQEFYENLHKEFIDIFKEQKQDIDRNMNLWNESLRLDMKNAFCDLNSSNRQSFKEILSKVMHFHNDMQMRMQELENKRFHSNTNHSVIQSSNLSQVQEDEDANTSNTNHYYPLKRSTQPKEHSLIVFESTKRKSSLENSRISTSPNKNDTFFRPFNIKNTDRGLKRKPRYISNSEASPKLVAASPALTLISQESSPGVSIKEIKLFNSVNNFTRNERGSNRMATRSWQIKNTNSAYRKFWDL